MLSYSLSLFLSLPLALSLSNTLLALPIRSSSNVLDFSANTLLNIKQAN